MLSSRRVEEQEPSGASRDADIHIPCGLRSIISVGGPHAESQWLHTHLSDNEIYLIIYLPGRHAVKTKQDSKALAHFIKHSFQLMAHLN